MKVRVSWEEISRMIREKISFSFDVNHGVQMHLKTENGFVVVDAELITEEITENFLTQELQ